MDYDVVLWNHSAWKVSQSLEKTINREWTTNLCPGLCECIVPPGGSVTGYNTGGRGTWWFHTVHSLQRFRSWGHPWWCEGVHHDLLLATVTIHTRLL